MIFSVGRILIILLLLTGCNRGNRADNQRELTVFAAASLTDAFLALAESFEAQNPDVQIILNFAGSSQLAAQLREGAPADLFASANPAQMQAVIAAGQVEPGSETEFATNQLTLVVPQDNPAEIAAFEDLARPNVGLILAVEGVPIRQYTDQILASMPGEFQDSFYANLLSEEDNVRQVLAKIALGEADAGIVYTSDITPDLDQEVREIAIPTGQNVVAAYSIAPLADTADSELSQRFINFVLSPAGQDILMSWGFGPKP
ncbi:MAG: molybdate ABC transporter substrate-binding protein [Ardenticatenaceae bacterium]|nr:molybdate ABC transporter substrate-binding protein [Ardenticatenaceae bacterium]